MNKLYEIPEGYIQVIPYNNEFIIHPKEIKIYDEDELIHYFVFVTDYSNFRIFDRVTGEFKKYRKQTKMKLFENEDTHTSVSKFFKKNEQTHTEVQKSLKNAGSTVPDLENEIYPDIDEQMHEWEDEQARMAEIYADNYSDYI